MLGSRDHAKRRRKATVTSNQSTGSYSDEPTSPDSLPALRQSTSNSTNPTPSVPGTPFQSPAGSFSPNFSYEDAVDLLPTVSELNSPPHEQGTPRSRAGSRRGSSFSEKLRNRLLDPSVGGERRGSKPKVKHPDVLEKESTSKLLKFWNLVHGNDESSSPLPSISEDTGRPVPSPQPVSRGERFLSHFGLRKSSGRMDGSRLAPVAYGAPKRSAQMQDARDMYQTVVRNAERAGVDVPPYDFLELIGKGAFGRVYKCKKRGTGVLVAIKIIMIDDSDFQEHVAEKDLGISAFRKEVDILQQLKDKKAKNINMIHDAFDIHSQLWIVSDYCTGGSIRTLMRANPRQGFEEHYIIPIARELAVAMKAVHDIGVIHRDIKCANVYVNEEGEIQLGDFGIVGMVEEDTSSKRRTIIGTPHYLPMEMHTTAMQTAEAYGMEVDIWAFGVTLYEMAAGHPPYSNVQPNRLAEALSTAPRLEGGNYSDGLRDFVAFCLNSDPKARPSADEVLMHPYIAGTEHKYPTKNLVKLIERYAVWEFGGGQRQSLFFAGGAAAPVVPTDEPEEGEHDDALDWNFSTSDTFNEEFGRRYSQMIATQDFANEDFDVPAGAGLPPLVTKDLSRFEEMERDFKELSANRGERSLDRLFNPEQKPYELHTPIEDDNEPLSDLPLRNFPGTAPTRESMIDLDSAATMDLNVPAFNFDFGDVPTLRARNSRSTGRHENDDESFDYGANERDDRRATRDWKFPAVASSAEEKKRATMDWSFSTAQPTEPDEPDVSMHLPSAGADGLAAGFRPTLRHMTTEPLGKFGDHMHPTQPLQPLMEGSSSPVRDSMASMIDLDMGLADPGEIVRPSTASSTTGSVMTDITSGNPFDLEEDPEQNEIDRNRFSFHKQWQSEGGNLRRRSHKHMQMHSRGSSLTSTDSELDRRMSQTSQPRADDVFDYDYSRSLNDAVRNGMGGMQIPESETSMNHWPDFGQNSGLDESPQYLAHHVPRMGEQEYPLQQGLRTTNGFASHTSVASRDRQRSGRGALKELEFPEPVAPHPDALLEDADPNVMVSEMDRLLDDFSASLSATRRALRIHTGVRDDEMENDDLGEENETDSGVESSSAAPTGDEEGF
ncbi:hypothetical protein LTR86_004048 [Recurvomyces mirabilis]|nr:hypothetical protein LTR86_004048 [Recurvomyces mirabilis]